jgi:hypothetical protein
MAIDLAAWNESRKRRRVEQHWTFGRVLWLLSRTAVGLR